MMQQRKIVRSCSSDCCCHGVVVPNDELFIIIVMYCKICLVLPYGVATISRLLKITGLFCKRALYKRRYSAKETCDFKEPTTRSHPIPKNSE